MRYGRGHGRDRGLSGTSRSKRPWRRGLFNQNDLYSRRNIGHRQMVIGVGGVDHASRLDDNLLTEGVAQPSHNRTMHLANRVEGVQRTPDVLSRDVPENGDSTGLRVHLDFGHVRAETGFVDY